VIHSFRLESRFGNFTSESLFISLIKLIYVLKLSFFFCPSFICTWVLSSSLSRRAVLFIKMSYVSIAAATTGGAIVLLKRYLKLIKIKINDKKGGKRGERNERKERKGGGKKDTVLISVAAFLQWVCLQLCTRRLPHQVLSPITF
jgi:hypothetical protein